MQTEKQKLYKKEKNNNCNNRQNIIQTKKIMKKFQTFIRQTNVTSKKGKYLYQSESKKKSK